MAYVIGRLAGKIRRGGIVEAQLNELNIFDGNRPQSAEEYGGDQNQIDLLNTREVGKNFDTLIRIGGGTALLLNPRDLFLADNEKLYDLILEKIGLKVLPEEALIGSRRTKEAGGSKLCQDICAGVPRNEKIKLELTKEIVEIGLRVGNMRGNLILPDDLRQYQQHLDEEQEKCWAHMEGIRLATNRYSIRLEEIDIGKDILNGEKYSLSSEKSGSMEIINYMWAELPADGFIAQDLEAIEDQAGNPISLLNRQVLLAIPKVGGPAMQIGLNQGGFDWEYPVLELSGGTLRANTNTKSSRVLRDLGWIA